MKYQVRVNIPVIVTVDCDTGGHWRERFNQAGQAAIDYVISDMMPEELTDALRTLRENGLAYPDDYSEVIEEIEA